MSDIRFECRECGQHIQSPSDMAGDSLECPTCSCTLKVPRKSTLRSPRPRTVKTARAIGNASPEATTWQWLAPGDGGRELAEIKFSCPICNQHIGAPLDMAGRELSCPNCRREIRIPSIESSMQHTVVRANKTACFSLQDEQVASLKQERSASPWLKRLSFFGLSGKGSARENNEDAYLCLPYRGLFAVADGMGGLADGRLASDTVIHALCAAFDTEMHDSAGRPLGVMDSERLIVALRRANRLLIERSKTHGRPSGSTIAAVLFGGDVAARACVLHAGDSRVYRFRNGVLEQLTCDDTVAGMLGSDDRALPHFFRNKLIKAVGIQSELAIASTFVDVEESDVFLICSDGLTRKIDNTRLDRMVGELSGKGLSTLCRSLAETALAEGSDDDVTVIAVRVNDGVQHESA